MRRTRDHDFETATPYYYAANLESWGIKAELTASKQAAFYRFTFPASGHAHLVLHMEGGAEIAVDGDRAIQDSARIAGPIDLLWGLRERPGSISMRSFRGHLARIKAGRMAH